MGREGNKRDKVAGSAEMYEFHASVHVMTEPASRSETYLCNGHPFHTLAISPENRGTRIAISFEKTAETLTALPRLFFEPDGSFIWVSSTDEQ